MVISIDNVGVFISQMVPFMTVSLMSIQIYDHNPFDSIHFPQEMSHKSYVGKYAESFAAVSGGMMVATGQIN